MGVSRATTTGGEIELEVRVAGVLLPRDRRASEVRVEEDPRRVDHRLQQRSSDRLGACACGLGVTRRDRGARRIDEQRVWQVYV